MYLDNYNFNERTKHAYLILCHNKFDLLKKQLTLLDDERNDIYIHVDKKTVNFPKQELENAVCNSKVFWVKRIRVNWGGYSIIKAELSLLEAACKRKYSYYHLISGMDLPIKTQDFIHKFFVENYGKEYVRFDPDCTRKNEYENRVKYYYFFQDIIGRNNGYLFYILDKMQAVLLKVQKVLKVNRLNSGLEIRKGTNWFSITHKFAEYVISKKILSKNSANSVTVQMRFFFKQYFGIRHLRM